MLAVIDATLSNRLAILITIPYHVRDSEELWRRYGKHAETTIHGHRAAAKRLKNTPAFREIDPGGHAAGRRDRAHDRQAAPLRDAAPPPEPRRARLW